MNGMPELQRTRFVPRVTSDPSILDLTRINRLPPPSAAQQKILGLLSSIKTWKQSDIHTLMVTAHDTPCEVPAAPLLPMVARAAGVAHYSALNGPSVFKITSTRPGTPEQLLFLALNSGILDVRSGGSVDFASLVGESTVSGNSLDSIVSAFQSVGIQAIGVIDATGRSRIGPEWLLYYRIPE